MTKDRQTQYRRIASLLVVLGVSLFIQPTNAQIPGPPPAPYNGLSVVDFSVTNVIRTQPTGWTVQLSEIVLRNQGSTSFTFSGSDSLLAQFYEEGSNGEIRTGLNGFNIPQGTNFPAGGEVRLNSFQQNTTIRVPGRHDARPRLRLCLMTWIGNQHWEHTCKTKGFITGNEGGGGQSNLLFSPGTLNVGATQRMPDGSWRGFVSGTVTGIGGNPFPFWMTTKVRVAHVSTPTSPFFVKETTRQPQPLETFPFGPETITLPSSLREGVNTVGFCVDYTSDSTGGSSCQTKQITLSAGTGGGGGVQGIDLTIADSDIRGRRVSASEVEVIARVRNIGTTAAPPFSVHIFGNDVWPAFGDQNPRAASGLGPGQSQEFTIRAPNPPDSSSRWYVSACADIVLENGNVRTEVQETNETNNCTPSKLQPSFDGSGGGGSPTPSAAPPPGEGCYTRIVLEASTNNACMADGKAVPASDALKVPIAYNFPTSCDAGVLCTPGLFAMGLCPNCTKEQVQAGLCVIQPCTPALFAAGLCIGPGGKPCTAELFAAGLCVGINPSILPGPIDDFMRNNEEALSRANLALALTSALAAIGAFTNTLLSLLSQLPQLPSIFGSMFSSRRRKDRWWLVVDSDLGKPVRGAIVQVYDMGGKLRETQVTGADGQCGFLLPPGVYTIFAKHAGFMFPATHKPPLTLRNNEQLYFTGEIMIPQDSIDHPEKLPHLIIPLDREVAVARSRVLFQRGFERFIALLDAISFPMLILGASLNTLFVLYRPVWLNIAFEVLYALLFVLKLVIRFTRSKGLGTITDAETGKPVDLATIRVYDTATNRLIQTRVTGTDGRFFLLLPKGTYLITVIRTGYQTFLEKEVTVKGRRAQALSLTMKLQKATGTSNLTSGVSRPDVRSTTPDEPEGHNSSVV